ncbi:hypothetical protein LSH36_804g00035 [Paralvinella palmiformis]|uniref:Ig-like domain-containing protein n=1 Tax=Paralvinella palmiformis TaxID=53620 RepID=A0AAD9J0B7_9ANNE|nr:hypothetical protein LSH36_804g00035 [Paralvinella palmiformis]
MVTDIIEIYEDPAGSSDSNVRLPPSIVSQNEDLFIYLNIDSKLKLVCDAHGYPEPTYEWYKDGYPWNYKPGDVIPTPGSGNMTVKSFTYTHAGEFQCFASNKYGKTMTPKMTVGAAVIAKFPQEDSVSHIKKEGESLKINCNVPKSEPPATVSWQAVESLDQNAQSIKIPLTRRVQIDDEGNLVFSNLLLDDQLNNWYYRCVAENALAGLIAVGSYAQITVNRDPGKTYSPKIMSYTGSNSQGGTVIGLKRESVSLRCLFSGLPTPSVTWSRSDGKPLPHDRIDYEDYNTVLRINNVEDYDEGTYRCTGNGIGNNHKDILLKVEAVPDFIESLKPVNINATDGEDVLFHCETDAEPKAVITWYMNSEELTGANIPARVSIENDGKLLRVTEVCKDCKSGTSDLKVYACEARNEHGYTFSSGYLNVLLPTVVIKTPADHDLTFTEKQITFTCEGVTDDSTPLTVRWLRDGQRIEYIKDEIYQVDTESGSTLYIITKKLDESGKEYVGNYTCILSNGYSSVNATAALNDNPGTLRSGNIASLQTFRSEFKYVCIPLENPPPPYNPAVKASSVAELWWVFLIVGILLLLLLLLLCCCICLQRNKGDTYPVDEKERANGNDPEKELADTGYHDYQRPEDEPVKGSRASLSSAMKLDDSDEDDASLAEYGDIDTGKFNEDGSFIGQYNTADRRRAESNV